MHFHTCRPVGRGSGFGVCFCYELAQLLAAHHGQPEHAGTGSEGFKADSAPPLAGANGSGHRW